MSNRLDQEKEAELSPKRMEYAFTKINNAGYDILHSDSTKLIFEFNGHQVTLFPYSGWHTGKSITDGRGLQKLLKQIKK